MKPEPGTTQAFTSPCPVLVPLNKKGLHLGTVIGEQPYQSRRLTCLSVARFMHPSPQQTRLEYIGETTNMVDRARCRACGSLQKCRGFQGIPLEEQKPSLVKIVSALGAVHCQHILQRTARGTSNAPSAILEGHIAALHLGPALWIPSEPITDYGWESDNGSPFDVTSKFTQVCSGGFNCKSFSKI